MDVDPASAPSTTASHSTNQTIAVENERAGAYAPIVREQQTLPSDGGGRLELRGVEGQRVHVLRDRALDRGDEIELLLSDGYWLRGTYDWSGLEARWPGLRIELGGPWQYGDGPERPPAAVMALHPDAIVRWPEASARTRAR
jgi:hypothetical protein